MKDDQVSDVEEFQRTAVTEVPVHPAETPAGTARFDIGQELAVSPPSADLPESPGGTLPNTNSTWSATKQAGPRPVKLSVGHLPGAGTQLFGFHLRHELGHGASARVFLAEEADLAGRPVVIKVSDLEGHEPQTLAQLQHTNIVPIYSVHEDHSRRLRAVCMPYFGGATLSDVLAALGKGASPRNGHDLVRALRSVASPPVRPETMNDTQTPGLAHLERLTYVQAAAWVIARLAEGLHHAHQRGILHRDVKPSNVLLSADGQPMLLDFNLAQDQSDLRAPTSLGGTLAYMAPETLGAVVARDRQLARQVDQRADIYALGLILYEMVTGRRPFDPTASYPSLSARIEALSAERNRSAPSLRSRPDVPWSLESIARKCLAPNPARRYQSAEELAEDLRRFLDDRPLKHAPEMSRVECVQKWGRRHPRLAASAAITLAASLVLLAAGSALVSTREHLANTQKRLESAQARDKKRAHDSGTTRALCLVNTVTDGQDLAEQGAEVCTETLRLYGALDHNDWQDAADFRALDPAARHQVAEDVRELLLLLASARVRADPSEGARFDRALALLDRAAAIRGLAPSRALAEDRAVYLQHKGDAVRARAAREAAAAIPATTAREHYLLATALARTGRYAEAVAELDRALVLNPRHYWSWTQRGICYQEMGEPALAAGDFGVCVGLWPEFAWGYFNRAYALQQAGKPIEAIRDYTAALECDGKFLPAYRNRGLLRLEQRHYSEALADFDQVPAQKGDAGVVHIGRAVALEGLRRFPEADVEFGTGFAQLSSASVSTRTRALCAHGFAVAARLPEKARASFDQVLALAADHPQALYGRAMLLVERGEEKEALRDLDRAVAVAPGFIEGRRARAVLLARCRRFDEAGREINACLEREPANGQTLYAAACISTRAAEKAAPLAARLATAQALELLGRAFAAGYGRDRAERDPDLRFLQSHPEFQRLLKDTPEGTDR